MSNSSTFDLITVDELVARLDDESELFLLDVREPDEFAAWKIPGAVNIPLGDLANRLDEIPEHRSVISICARGARAEQAAVVLADHHRSSRVLDGGMASWGRAYDVVEIPLRGALVTQIRRRGKGCLSYVIGDDDKAVVIDPSTDLDRYLAVAAEHGYAITHVFDTHLHADHLSGARELAAATGAVLVLNPADPFNYEFTPIRDGLTVPISDNLHLVVSAVTTPGHTEGSTVYQLGDQALFTGDTLFLESVGRPDLADHAEPFARSLYRSLHDVVLPLNDDLLIFPAHYGDAVDVHAGVPVTRRLGELRRELPALAYSEEDFVQWAISRVTDRPPNYVEIVKFNAGRSALDIAELQQLELGPNRCAIAS